MDEIIKVTFHSPVNGEREYFFTSVAAIYQHFTAERIGVSLARLWGKHLSVANPIATKSCVISKHYIHRKSQTNPRK